ncbi:hypothetical protein JW921_00165, partial [Candidatus Fermentibacterales bacterium]|nr:hypothetical protein [Candidatus Fermentibacterales bacterium]
DGSPHPTTVKATSHGVVLVIPRPVLLAQTEQQPKLIARLMLGIGRLLARRLSLANRTLSVLSDKEFLEQKRLRALLDEMRGLLRIRRVV